MFLWLALDHDTKLVPTFAIGKRSADNARRFLMDIAKRYNFPNPHASDAHAYGRQRFQPIVQISTDGFAAYREAVDLAFGPYARYGQIIKDYRNAGMQYDPSEMIGAERRGIRGIGDDELNTICTSHIERFNATTRLFMKRMNRLTLCFSKKLDNLAAAVAMHVAYWNYCWQPATLGGYNTPARAAGMVDRPWTFAELFERIH
jgi:IS1 family transposase